MNKVSVPKIRLDKIEPTNYNCNICKDKGFLLNDKGEYIGKCKCTIRKESIARLKSSGLEFDSKRYRFGHYTTNKDWQKDYKQRAMDFVANPKGWFAMLGQPGIGKTHLMTAIAVQFIGKGKDIEYVKWVDEMLKSKNNYWNIDPKFVKRMETVEVLYIDDLFKVEQGQDVHQEENRIAFRIIDARYGNPNLITLISSEKSLEDMEDINEGLTGRILEMCGGSKSPNYINASYRQDGNYRLR